MLLLASMLVFVLFISLLWILFSTESAIISFFKRLAIKPELMSGNDSEFVGGLGERPQTSNGDVELTSSS